MKIKDKIYLSHSEGPLPEEMFKDLKYANPEYYAKMNMGLPLWGVPKEILTYRIRREGVEILRGEFSKIRPYIPHLSFEAEHPETPPIDLVYKNDDFDLDPHQERAIEAIKANRQGIVHAVTSAGKSVMILKAICDLNVPTIVIVHRKLLMKQLLEDIEKYVRHKDGSPVKSGIVAEGKATIGPITIAIDATLKKHIHELRDSFGAVILDECHIAPANTLLSLINQMNSKYRFGFSGTLKRKDQKEFLIYSTFGRVIAEIGKEELLDLGRVVPVEVRVIESETRFEYESAVEAMGATKAYQLMEKTLAVDPGRSDMILELVSNLPGKTIVLSRMVEPCFRLSKRLQDERGIESGIITGKDPKLALQSYEGMKKADLRVIFATVGCVSTGISISDLDNIVLIAPIYTNELLLHQIRGRLMRTSEGKTHGTLYFVYDPWVFPERKLKKFLKIIRS